MDLKVCLFSSSDYSSTSDVKSCGTNSFLDDDGPIQTLLAEWNEFISETNEETSKQVKQQTHIFSFIYNFYSFLCFLA